MSLGTLAAAGVTAGIGARLRAVIAELGVPADLGTASVDRLVEIAILAGGLALGTWLAGWLLVATLCVATRGLGARWRVGEQLVLRWAPTIVRRALVVLVGTGLGLSAATAAQATSPDDLEVGWTWASTSSSTRATSEAGVVGASTSPSVPASSTSLAAVATSPPDQAALDVATSPTSVVVQTGDSLWLIAEQHLPPGATDASIAAAWPGWYAANADTIGDDPDLLEPGTTLHAPAPSANPAQDGAS